MLETVFVRVREGKVDVLRAWMEELGRRRNEVLETYRNEGTRHERAFLFEGKDGPVLVYVMEIGDSEGARQAYRDSELPIDVEHKKVMEEVLAGRAEAEELLDLGLPREDRG